MYESKLCAKKTPEGTVQQYLHFVYVHFSSSFLTVIINGFLGTINGVFGFNKSGTGVWSQASTLNFFKK